MTTPPDAKRGPGKGPAQVIPDEEDHPQGTPHDPTTCATCLGHLRWTPARRDAERSRLACLGVHQLEEVLC